MKDDGDGSSTLYHEEFHPPFLPALVILPFLLPFFWKYRVTIDDTQLQFGYSSGLTSKTVDRFDIISVEPIEHLNGLTWGGGWGIRVKLTGKEIGYISKNGPAVKIQVEAQDGRGGIYVFNCKDPQLVCAILSPTSQRQQSDEAVGDDTSATILPLIS